MTAQIRNFFRCSIVNIITSNRNSIRYGVEIVRGKCKYSFKKLFSVN